METLSVVFANCERNGQMIGDENSHVPSDIIKILFVLVIDDPGRHDSAVIKCPGPSEGKQWLVMNVEDVLRSRCFNFNIGRLGTTVSVSCAKVDSQNAY